LKRTLKLIRFFVWRNMREEKFLTLLSILGVALGVGLFIGVKVASDRAITSFEADVRGLDRQANYEVLDVSGVDFDETIYRNVRLLNDKSMPALRVDGFIPSWNREVVIEGIYTVRAMENAGPAREEYHLEDFFREPNGVIVTKKFAEANSLKRGSAFTAQVYDRQYTLKVVDIADFDYLPPNTILMDLGNFQEYFGKTGFLSRIDLETDDKTAEKIQKILPPGLAVEKKSEIIENRKGLLKSFRYNLQFVSLIAILVGMFLLYNTVFISVVKRRTEIGILRGLGAGKKDMVLLSIIQGAVIGLAGSLAGIAIGQVTAYFAVIAVQKTISMIYTSTAISDYYIHSRDAVTALAVGIFISIVASAVPAYEAARIRPREGYSEGSFEMKRLRHMKPLFFLGLLFAVSGGAVACIDYRFTPFDFPFLAYAGILLIILGFALCSPFYLSLVLSFFRKTLTLMTGATGKLAAGDMSGNVYRFSVALMSVAISSALIIALLTLIFSLRASLTDWMGRNISSDVYIKPSACKSNFCFYPLSGELIEEVKKFPEVESVERFRTLYIDYQGKKVVAGFDGTELRQESGRGGQAGDNGDEEDSAPRAGISRYLSIKFGLKQGDSIELPTPKGPVRFIVSEVFSSYSTTSGFIFMDRKWMKKYWGLDDATQIIVYVKQGADAGRLIEKLKRTLLPRYSVDIMSMDELRQRVLSIFNKTFAITYAIELISIIVSLIGVINMLLALVLERKREISIIRYLGGSWKQIRNILVLSAGIIGIGGIVYGAFLGWAMSLIFINVINKISFGWEIHFRPPLLYLLIVCGILFLTTLLAGLIPSRVARKTDPKRFVSFE
jgi:putative ABC transport system permease protein